MVTPGSSCNVYGETAVCTLVFTCPGVMLTHAVFGAPVGKPVAARTRTNRTTTRVQTRANSDIFLRVFRVTTVSDAHTTTYAVRR